MTALQSKRIQSIDILRGLAMVIMAIDHVRDFFHSEAFLSDPSNLETTTPELFLTRFITHYCAPVFILLSGTSAFLYGQHKTKKALSKFLLTRGLWLIFVEIVIMNFLWWFDPTYSFLNLQVIWAIGLCMMVLSAIIYLPMRWILILGLMLVFGHNLLDGISVQGSNFGEIIYGILHQPLFIPYGEGRVICFLYPILPWIGVMSLGYCLGQLYIKSYDAKIRKKILINLGLLAIVLFLLLRTFNFYGEPNHWMPQDRPIFSFLSFINVTKYPPSLLFLLITLGPSLILLALIEPIKNRITSILVVYGRVPFFYYVLHVLVIHLTAIAGLLITGESWKRMILTADVFMEGKLAGYGYSLFKTYIIWVFVVLLMFPLCRWYMNYKLKHKDKWWLSYL